MIVQLYLMIVWCTMHVVAIELDVHDRLTVSNDCVVHDRLTVPDECVVHNASGRN